MKNKIQSLEYVAKQVDPNISIIETSGSPVGVCTRVNENGEKHILWDNMFWDFFEQIIFTFDTLSYDELHDKALITEYTYNIFGILFNHLSKRYEFLPILSSAFRKLAEDYNYHFFDYIYPKSKENSILKNENEFTLCISQYIVLYHELGHNIYADNKEKKEEIFENLTQNLKNYFSNICSLDDAIDINLENVIGPDSIDKDAIKENFKKILKDDSNPITEELFCDYYAILKVFDTFSLTMHDKEYIPLISNEIIKILPIYYLIITSYSYLCIFWDYIVPQVLTFKRIDCKIMQNELNSFSESEVVIRNIFFQNFLSLIVFGKEENAGYPIDLKKRMTLNNANINKNIYLFSNAFALNINNNIMDIVFEETKKMSNENIIKNSYKKIPENAMIVSWLSNQYHNNLGIKFWENGDYLDALEEFKKTILICNNLNGIGHYHKFTARAYNNMASVFLMLSQTLADMPYATSNDISINHLLNTIMPNSPFNYVCQAKQYSDNAVDIIIHTKSKIDMNYAAIFQNAGAIYHSLGKNYIALQNYFIAHKVKNELLDFYSQYHALTDFSIAIIYYEEKKWDEAEQFCKPALDFYTTYIQKNDRNRKNCEELYKKIITKLNR